MRFYRTQSERGKTLPEGTTEFFQFLSRILLKDWKGTIKSDAPRFSSDDQMKVYSSNWDVQRVGEKYRV